MQTLLEMPIDEQLRDAIAQSGLSANQLAENTGLHQTVISRFIKGQSDIRLSAVMKLADYFGLVLAPADDRPAKRKRTP